MGETELVYLVCRVYLVYFVSEPKNSGEHAFNSANIVRIDLSPKKVETLHLH